MITYDDNYIIMIAKANEHIGQPLELVFQETSLSFLYPGKHRLLMVTIDSTYS